MTFLASSTFALSANLRSAGIDGVREPDDKGVEDRELLSLTDIDADEEEEGLGSRVPRRTRERSRRVIVVDRITELRFRDLEYCV